MTLSIDASTVVRPLDQPTVERGDDDDAGAYVISFASAGLAVVLSTEQLDALVSRALDSKLADEDEFDRVPSDEDAATARRELRKIWPFEDMTDDEFGSEFGK